MKNPFSSASASLVVHCEKLDFYLDSQQVFDALYAQAAVAFWLDSPPQSGGRFSYMGDASGPNAAWFEYFLAEKNLYWYNSGAQPSARVPCHPESVFSFLSQQLQRCYLASPNHFPLEFNGGFVGYLGFELKAECGYPSPSPGNLNSNHADACFIFSDRFVAFDHHKKSMYLVECRSQQPDGQTNGWLADTRAQLQALRLAGHRQAPTAASSKSEPTGLKGRIADADYLQKIAEIKQKIKAGETYEACLTNQLSVETQAQPLALYCALRACNPAPYAAYLRFASVAVLSASPEKFLHIDTQGRVETKPIKGTRPRGTDPTSDKAIRQELARCEKDRSENLMIVDLLRNDLGKISEVGSVKVPQLFHVETFATVHQLVSTIQSRLAAGKTALDCVAACFPGGSMTGAPKKRSLEILEQLEQGPRGIYSGSIGFFAINGAAHLNIVIRTMVLAHGLASIGVGGAIIDASDPQLELEETQLKAQALLQVLARFE